MRSSKRTLIAFLLIGAVLFISLGVAAGLASARPAPGDSPAATTATGPLIISGQKPRFQDFFAGGNAVFTVSITNTGSINFQTVTVSDAVSPDCNRGDLGALAPGQSTSYTCTRANVTESYLNELQANGTTTDTTVSHRSNAFVKVLKQELRITKTPQVQTIRHGATAYFTVKLFNTSDSVITIEEVDDSLVDDCDRLPTITINLDPAESVDYPCSISNVQAPLATVATVRARNPATSEEYIASDVAWVEILNLQAGMTPQPTALPEPGGPVTYTINLVNSGSVPVTLVGLTTNKFGNILDPGNSLVEAATNNCLPQPTLPTLPPYGGSYECRFVALVEGQPSDFSAILTATARGPNSMDVTATTNAIVTITNVPASMKVTLSADPPFINPPSQQVSFSVLVENTSGADAITITGVTDEFLGDLDGRGTCEFPVEGLPAGFSYQCRFADVVSGQVGQQKSRTVTVDATSDDQPGEILTVSELVTVNITDQPTRNNFMPNVSDHTLDRTSCGRPYPLTVNTQYYFRPPNRYDSTLPPEQREQDYFTFELTQSRRVRVELTNFVPRKGQLIIRPHVTGNVSSPCGSIPLGRNPDEALNKVVDLGTQPAGRYYIQIINDGPSNVPDLYGLIVRID